MPTSGAEPPYEPGKWNDGGAVQRTNNCYSYAADDFRPHNDAFGLPQPGIAGGITAPFPLPISCSQVMFRAESDGFTPHDCDTVCASERYKVMVFVSQSPKLIGDYHFYRQDQGGCWSSKRGRDAVTDRDAAGKRISDPRLANRNYGGGPNYTEFCGCLCVRRGTQTETPTPKSGGL